ncbi:MAG: hypothetical protein PHO23_02690 [Candidatus Pacebacteria bacterium]|nr:hypothetical protein [Candidatus Paceibacterota bacterium]
MLVTATPVNNNLKDLTSQLLIGTKGEVDTVKMLNKGGTYDRGQTAYLGFKEIVDNLQK